MNRNRMEQELNHVDCKEWLVVVVLGDPFHFSLVGIRFILVDGWLVVVVYIHIHLLENLFTLFRKSNFLRSKFLK
jgi:hypothetical protein